MAQIWQHTTNYISFLEVVKIDKPSSNTLKQNNQCHSSESMNRYCGIWAFCVCSSWSSMVHYGRVCPETVPHCSWEQKWDGASWHNILSVPVWFAAVLPLFLCKPSTSSLCVYRNKDGSVLFNLSHLRFHIGLGGSVYAPFALRFYVIIPCFNLLIFY